MLRINISKTSQKFLEKLAEKQRKQIVRKIVELAENPNPPDCKPIQNTTCLRTDIGEYRIAYRVIEESLHIPLIGKRNDDEIYKKIKRLN